MKLPTHVPIDSRTAVEQVVKLILLEDNMLVLFLVRSLLIDVSEVNERGIIARVIRIVQVMHMVTTEYKLRKTVTFHLKRL